MLILVNTSKRLLAGLLSVAIAAGPTFAQVAPSSGRGATGAGIPVVPGAGAGEGYGQTASDPLTLGAGEWGTIGSLEGLGGNDGVARQAQALRQAQGERTSIFGTPHPGPLPVRGEGELRYSPTKGGGRNGSFTPQQRLADPLNRNSNRPLTLPSPSRGEGNNGFLNGLLSAFGKTSAPHPSPLPASRGEGEKLEALFDRAAIRGAAGIRIQDSEEEDEDDGTSEPLVVGDLEDGASTGSARTDSGSRRSEKGKGEAASSREGKKGDKDKKKGDEDEKADKPTLLRKFLGKLFSLRKGVQKDARDILLSELGGDVGDGRLHRDVVRVLKRLTDAAELPAEAAQVFIGNSFIPNAFTTVVPTEANNPSIKAFRVSNVFITLGLLRSVQTESRLAFVLAHELMHNWKGHLKDFSGVGQVFLGHFHELEADAEALKLVAKAGYEPKDAIDTLYDLDREMDRIEKEYSLFKRNKDDVTESLNRVRDVHPHSDIRRANLLDHLDAALEGFRPYVGDLAKRGKGNGSTPHPSPLPASRGEGEQPAFSQGVGSSEETEALPVWMVRRSSAERPSHLDRFDLRLKKATQSAATIEDGLDAIEGFIELEKTKGELSYEEWASVEEAYRALVKRSKTREELRDVEVAANLQAKDGVFPSRKMRADLITRQLDFVFEKIGRRATLAEFVPAAEALAFDARRGGTMRLLGQIRTRAELDAAFKTLKRKAEVVGLDLGLMLDHHDMNARQKGEQLVVRVVQDVAKKLWRATRAVLTEELKRPAKPEEIIAELHKKLGAARLAQYRTAFNIELLDSAFGPLPYRSEKYRPSQLATMLEGKKVENFKHEKPIGQKVFPGLDLWTNRHYKPPRFSLSLKKPQFGYERYYVKGMSSPSLEDQLDVWFWFAGANSVPPPMMKLLEREGKLKVFQLTAARKLADHAREGLKKDTSPQARKFYVRWYAGSLQKLMLWILLREKDFKAVREKMEVAWSVTEELLDEEGIKGTLDEESQTLLADSFFTSLGNALRGTVVWNDLAGLRPDRAEIGALSGLVRKVEARLQPYAGVNIVLGHSRKLREKLGSDRTYMEAYRKAVPWVVEDDDVPYGKFWRIRRFFRWVANLFKSRKWSLPGVPEKEGRSLDGNVDFVNFLILLGRTDVEPETGAMAAALLDRLDMGRSDHFFGKQTGMRASETVARWLLEDSVASLRSPPKAKSFGEVALRINSLHPGFLQPDLESVGNVWNGFREGAGFVRRNEPYRSLAKAEHPFRDINSKWALELIKKLERGRSWPGTTEDKLDLLDFLNATGEFVDAIDQRVLDTAAADPAGFRRWIERDRKRLEKFGVDADLGHVETPIGMVPVPLAQPLRIVRNPNLRIPLFDHLPEAKLGETAPTSLRKKLRGWIRLWKAYREARKWFSKEFLDGIQHEGSLEDKFIEVMEEVDRVAAERASKARKRWDSGEMTKDDVDFLRRAGRIADPRKEWKNLPKHRKGELEDAYKANEAAKAMSVLVELYNAFAGTQEPVLGVLLDNYPEPTRSRDELLERLIKARRLTPASLSYLESHKSYRQPNPLRITEKHLLDLAVVQFKKFSPAERVDLLLHLAGVERLSKERERLFNKRILSGDRKKIARDMAAVRSLAQLESYITLLHPRDKALLVRSMFYGKTTLHQAPAEVERLWERLVIQGRGLPAFMQKVLRSYFRILNDDEKARLLSDLAALTDVSRDLTGPKIVKVALKGMGVSGAKVAQVLSTHRGLVPPEYADALEDFKEKAQSVEKIRAYTLSNAGLAALTKAIGGEVKGPGMDELLQVGKETLPQEGEAALRRLAKQVGYLIKAEKKRVRFVEAMGPELGSGSIKIVYKVTLDDGKVWVVKLRVPGSAYRISREFEILDLLLKKMEADGDLDLPGAEQLLDEVKSLVKAEMDFRDEAKIEARMVARVANRPLWARLMGAPNPYIPKPHEKYAKADLLIEEFAPTQRFSSLPNWNPFGPTKSKISKLAIEEGMYALVSEEWLEPDPHTGNRHAVRRPFGLFGTRLVVMDLGQGLRYSAERLKPLMRAGLALDAGDEAAAAKALAAIVRVPPKRTPDEVEQAILHGFAAAGLLDAVSDDAVKADTSKPKQRLLWEKVQAMAKKGDPAVLQFLDSLGTKAASLDADYPLDGLSAAELGRLRKVLGVANPGVIERLMEALIESEKKGALVLPEYAPLQKAFILYTGYNPWLPKDFIFRALERAAAVRLVREKPSRLPYLMYLSVKRTLFGRKAVRPAFEALIDGLGK